MIYNQICGTLHLICICLSSINVAFNLIFVIILFFQSSLKTRSSKEKEEHKNARTASRLPQEITTLEELFFRKGVILADKT